ncbi:MULTISPECIES: hypothetical protein [unclassified Cupriavidus]|uniref:hypothetical protein n=1 Tax=Cupriavidus sp. H19C3 TaxID=3241603 RepID=UPI0011DC2E1E|nr:MAG: hypothetical protein E6Q40_17035 [Cupriavidus sp.]
MYRVGTWLVGAALALAALGVFFSDPSEGPLPERLNLFRIALHGLEVQMVRIASDPPRYLVNVLARDWLLGCAVLALLGAVLMLVARVRERA